MIVVISLIRTQSLEYDLRRNRRMDEASYVVHYKKRKMATIEKKFGLFFIGRGLFLHADCILNVNAC